MILSEGNKNDQHLMLVIPILKFHSSSGQIKNGSRIQQKNIIMILKRILSLALGLIICIAVL